MYVDSSLKALYKADSTVKNTCLDFYHQGESEPFLSLGGDGRIMGESMKISESLSSSENLDFGSCEASQFEITVIDVEEDIIGSSVVVYQTLSGLYPSEERYPSDEIYPDGYIMPLGTYIIQSAQRQNNGRYRDVLALDPMILFDVNVIEWYNALPLPLTLREFRARLCEHIGVTEHVPDYLPNDDMIVEKTIDAVELIGRDVLIACEQVNGAFGHFDRNGILQHVRIKSAENENSCDETLESYLCISCRAEEYTVKAIDTVRIRQEEGDIGAIYGDGNNCYLVEGNFLVFGKSAAELDQIAAGIHSMISGFKYVPYEYRGKGLPYLDVGSPVWIQRDGIATYVMKRTLTGTYALKDDYSATGEEIRSTENNVNTEIIQLKGRSAILRRTVDEVSATVTDLEKETQAQFKLMSDKIELKVSKGEISSQLSIESGQVTISGNRLVVNSTNFKLDSGGNVSVTGNITGSTITGSTFASETFYADDKEVRIGDFYVSVDSSNKFSSADGSIVFDTGTDPGGSSYASLKIKNGEREVYIGYGTGRFSSVVYAPYVDGYDSDNPRYSYFYDIELGRSWWGGDSITDTVRKLWENCDGVSDERAKTNIESIDSDEAITFLMNSHPVTFQYRRDGKWSAGFIAQEIDETMDKTELYYPIVGTDQKTGFYKVDYRTYIPLLVSAVQNLQTQIAELRGDA